MKLLNNLIFIALILTSFTGCVTIDSKVQTVDVKVEKSNYKKLFVLPIDGPDKRLVAQHLGITGVLPNGSMISSGKGLYEYTFDHKDVNNIKKTIAKSLEASGAFESVTMFSGEVTPHDALFLKVHLYEAGILGDAFYTAVLKGKAGVLDARNQKLIQVKFDVSGAGSVTVSQSKNKAIKKSNKKAKA